MSHSHDTLPSVSVDGVQSPYRQSGPTDSSEAVVFLHGNPGSAEDWADLLARVARHARAVAPEMPGYGRADRPRAFDYTVEGYARHFDGVLGELGVDRAHVVLHDFGGPWGLLWAAEHPERVGSVTLINTGVLVGYRWHRFARIWQTPVLGELFMAAANKKVLARSLNATNPKPLPKEFIDTIDSFMDRGHKRAVLKLYRATKEVDAKSRAMQAALAPHDHSCQVVWGAADRFLPVKFAAKQRDAFPSAKVSVLEGCGHWPMIDDPDGVAEIVVPFLEEQLARTRR